jgi:hypothetical protein
MTKLPPLECHTTFILCWACWQPQFTGMLLCSLWDVENTDEKIVWVTLIPKGTISLCEGQIYLHGTLPMLHLEFFKSALNSSGLPELAVSFQWGGVLVYWVVLGVAVNGLKVGGSLVLSCLIKKPFNHGHRFVLYLWSWVDINPKNPVELLLSTAVQRVDNSEIT